jgi:hypothetical protein
MKRTVIVALEPIFEESDSERGTTREFFEQNKKQFIDKYSEYFSLDILTFDTTSSINKFSPGPNSISSWLFGYRLETNEERQNRIIMDIRKRSIRKQTDLENLKKLLDKYYPSLSENLPPDIDT